MVSSRRTFLRDLLMASSVGLAGLTTPRAARAAPQPPAHPTPRPGITGDKVLPASALGATPKLVPLFDGIRAIPAIADGIRCNCGCATLPGFYSLLSCFEGEGMARHCEICQGQGRVAVRLAKDGRSLDDIRAAIDAQFG